MENNSLQQHNCNSIKELDDNISQFLGHSAQIEIDDYTNYAHVLEILRRAYQTIAKTEMTFEREALVMLQIEMNFCKRMESILFLALNTSTCFLFVTLSTKTTTYRRTSYSKTRE